jgi:NhaA family Na+:H+ antiporter
MSLFIGSLAFEHAELPSNIDERVGILIGSLISAVSGYLLLRHSLKTRHTDTDASQATTK